MIGDWPDRDLAGARSVGIRTVFAKYGFSWSPDRTSIDTHPSDFVVHDILDLIDIVDRLNDVASSEGTPAHGR
jgi:putative hydrolase of the HAD superfamily